MEKIKEVAGSYPIKASNYFQKGMVCMKKRLFISIMCAVLLSATFVTAASAFKADDNTADERSTVVQQKEKNSETEDDTAQTSENKDNTVKAEKSESSSVFADRPEDVNGGLPVIEYDTDVYYADAAPMELVERDTPDTSVDIMDPSYLEEMGKINREWVTIRDTAIAEMTETGDYDKTGLEERINEAIERKKRLAETWERDRALTIQDGAGDLIEDAVPPVVDEDDIRSRVITAWIRDLAMQKADAARFDALLEITKKYGYTVKTVEGKELTGKDINDYAYYIPALMIACCNVYNDKNVDLSPSENARIVSFLSERTNILPELCQTNEQFGIAVNFMNRTIVFPKDMF